MAEQSLTALDNLLLDRWTDAVGIREGLRDLEDRLDERLEAVTDRLRPWFEGHGHVVFSVDRKGAGIDFGKPEWQKKRKERPLIYMSIAAIFPFGYRRVDEPPHVWTWCDGLPKPKWEPFQVELAKRIGDSHSEMFNDDCARYAPAGKYLQPHTDEERIRLARSADDLEQFIKTHVEPMFALSLELNHALKAVGES